jgi:hypothetical protein
MQAVKMCGPRLQALFETVGCINAGDCIPHTYLPVFSSVVVSGIEASLMYGASNMVVMIVISTVKPIALYSLY